MAPRTPKYRLHKPSGQAVVTIGGRDLYLGKYGTSQSRDEYDRLITEWLTNGRRLPTSAGGPSDLTICELVLAYLDFTQTFYRKNGELTSEVGVIKSSVRYLTTQPLYGSNAFLHR